MGGYSRTAVLHNNVEAEAASAARTSALPLQLAAAAIRNSLRSRIDVPLAAIARIPLGAEHSQAVAAAEADHSSPVAAVEADRSYAVQTCGRLGIFGSFLDADLLETRWDKYTLLLLPTTLPGWREADNKHSLGRRFPFASMPCRPRSDALSTCFNSFVSTWNLGLSTHRDAALFLTR
jgi:hypothetical protein